MGAGTFQNQVPAPQKCHIFTRSEGGGLKLELPLWVELHFNISCLTAHSILFSFDSATTEEVTSQLKGHPLPLSYALTSSISPSLLATPPTKACTDHPTPKKPSLHPTNLNYSRPIFLLLFTAKLLEHLIHNHLRAYLTEKRWTPSNLHVNYGQGSSKMAMSSLCHDVTSAVVGYRMRVSINQASVSPWWCQTTSPPNPYCGYHPWEVRAFRLRYIFSKVCLRAGWAQMITLVGLSIWDRGGLSASWVMDMYQVSPFRVFYVLGPCHALSNWNIRY